MPEPLDYAPPPAPTAPHPVAAVVMYLAASIGGLVLASIAIDVLDAAVRARRGDGGLLVLACFVAVLNGLLVLVSGRLFRVDRRMTIALAGLTAAVPLAPFTLCRRSRRTSTRFR